MPLSAASSFFTSDEEFSAKEFCAIEALCSLGHTTRVFGFCQPHIFQIFKGMKRNVIYFHLQYVRTSCFILYQSLAEAYTEFMHEIAFGAVFAYNLVASFVCANLVDQTSWNVGVFYRIGQIVQYVGEKPRARLQEELGTLAQYSDDILSLAPISLQMRVLRGKKIRQLWAL